MPISAFLITLNEEERIAHTLNSLKWTDEQIVVDGGSKDNTCEICREKGAKVFHRPFDDFENQKNYALSLATNDWVLSIDADEIVSPELAEEIKEIISQATPKAAYQIKRINYFLGKPLHFGGQGNDFVLRLFKKSFGKFSGIVHEEVQISGEVGTLRIPLRHLSTETLTEYYEKLKLYTDLDARRIVADHKTPSFIKAVCYPPLRWILNYILRFGFLDGRRGFLFHALSCHYGWLKYFKARTISKRSSR